jgi:peptidoglycan hydrolase-like protein with peptidoglycan-binding domain
VKSLLAALLTLAALAVAQADEIVTAVQSRLAKLGYYAGEVDGEWGSQTAAAVRRFQVAKELRVTGELNAATLNALGVKAPPPVPNARAVALADLFVGGPYLTAPPSFQVSIVKKAQQNLKLLGFYGGSANGAPDAALTDALRAYQKAHRFKASGRLDKTTLQALDLLTLPPED